ncbi:MAG: hypothetical protein Q9O74_03820 [Planctomycetota bacterium]|nr:hypothetical protein [Planctomycetota bacterium]
MRLFSKAATTDDTGKPRAIISIWQLRWDERHSDPAFAAAVHRLSRALIVEKTNTTIMAPLMMLATGGFFTYLTLLANSTIVLSYLVWAPPALALYWLLRREKLPRVAKRTADILLANGICPGCAYNLAGQPVTDELLKCSECGAAWLRSRIARFHSFSRRAGRSEARPLQLWWERVKTYERHGPTSIFDDRSFQRPVVSPHLAWPIRAADGDFRDRLLEARREMLSHGSLRRILGMCAFQVFAFIVVVANLRVGRPLNTFTALFLVPTAAYSAILTLRGAAGINTSHIKDAMLFRCLCPSCAADLVTDKASPPSGLTTCPECGAIWRLPSPRAGKNV